MATRPATATTPSTGRRSLLAFSYSDVPSGAIGSETDSPSWAGSPAAYSYDAQNRLTQMTPGTGGALAYGFDPSGNLTTLPTGGSASYDNAAELTSSALAATTTTYSYDANGQRTQAAEGATSTVSASYNGASELTSYNNSTATMSAASYDGDGLRATTTTTPSGGSAVNQTATWNTTSGIPQLLTDGSNAYIYGPGNAPLEQVQLNTGTTTYLISDRLGSIRGTINSSGTLIATTAYDAWGNPETPAGLTNTTPFGYAGAYTDPTGLTYLTRRYYDPQTGQFLTLDPLVDQTEAPYAYVNGDPVDNSDPTGLFCVGPICTHPFEPRASLDALVNIGRGATFGLTDKIANAIVPGASCAVAQNRFDQFVGGAASSLIGGEAAVLVGKWAALSSRAAGEGVFPETADEMSSILGVEPSYVGETVEGTPRVRSEPNQNTRITLESHPEGLKPGDEGFNPRHHGVHYHVQIRTGPHVGWNNPAVFKVTRPGYTPWSGTGFLPGESFPG